MLADLCTTTYPRIFKKWPFKIGGRCLQPIYAANNQNGTTKKVTLQSDCCYSEEDGLTVRITCKKAKMKKISFNQLLAKKETAEDKL
jgi:hypothetical protein